MIRVREPPADSGNVLATNFLKGTVSGSNGKRTLKQSGGYCSSGTQT